MNTLASPFVWIRKKTKGFKKDLVCLARCEGERSCKCTGRQRWFRDLCRALGSKLLSEIYSCFHSYSSRPAHLEDADNRPPMNASPKHDPTVTLFRTVVILRWLPSLWKNTRTNQYCLTFVCEENIEKIFLRVIFDQCHTLCLVSVGKRRLLFSLGHLSRAFEDPISGCL